jgi:hypothetical protein
MPRFSRWEAKRKLRRLGSACRALSPCVASDEVALMVARNRLAGRISACRGRGMSRWKRMTPCKRCTLRQVNPDRKSRAQDQDMSCTDGYRRKSLGRCTPLADRLG